MKCLVMYCLEQFVNLPNRQNHILDLVFVPTLSLLKELYTSPGRSDYKMVMFSNNCKHPLISEKAPCRVYLYHKSDIPGLKSKLQEFQEHFSASDPLKNLVEDNWQLPV